VINKESFNKELADLLNSNSIDNELNIPDHILADYLVNCLATLKETIQEELKKSLEQRLKDKENKDV